MRLVAIVVLFALLTGCGGPARLDGSNQEAYEASLDAVRAELDASQLKEFDKALGRVSLSKIGSLADAVRDPDGTLAKVRDSMDGMTGEEVIAAAKNLPKPTGPGAMALDAADRVRSEKRSEK